MLAVGPLWIVAISCSISAFVPNILAKHFVDTDADEDVTFQLDTFNGLVSSCWRFSTLLVDSGVQRRCSYGARAVGPACKYLWLGLVWWLTRIARELSGLRTVGHASTVGTHDLRRQQQQQQQQQQRCHEGSGGV